MLIVLVCKCNDALGARLCGVMYEPEVNSPDAPGSLDLSHHRRVHDQVPKRRRRLFFGSL